MGTTGQSITLANSIIGVGILAMPFCFQQCGVVLASLVLLSMGLVSRLCCYFLLKSALIARRRTFEFLAFHVFGPAGKFAVEIGIIGFLMGSCIAYFVVVGDLGPQIIAKMLNINQSDILRTSIMVVVSLVCVLPLGLLRNVDSLSNVSAATICFYFCLVLKVILEAASQLFSGSSEWTSRVALWRPAGLLQCVPIFSMALFCQTQLFEIFESMPTLSLEKMTVVSKNAINICTCVYFTLGLFGYIAFNDHAISGNILMSLSPTLASDVIKLGFVMSVAFSFPLIIFPCRASLYSFLYKKVHSSHHDHIINHSIPETSFRCITVAIIGVSLFISLLIPNIELVLGLVGSTIGVLICVVFPAACFVNVTFKNTNERILAKGIIVLGLVIMVLGTYANLEAAENKHDRYDDAKITQERIDKIVEDFFEKMEKSEGGKSVQAIKVLQNQQVKINGDAEKDSEIQPPNPIPPDSSNEKTKIKEAAEVNKISKDQVIFKDKINKYDKVSEIHPKNLKKNNGVNASKIDNDINAENKKPTEAKQVEAALDKKESKPKEQYKADIVKKDIIKQEKLIETIKQHGEEQKELLKEQKELLDEIIKTKNEMELNKKEVDNNEAKKIAVESIQKIADLAIKSLSGVTDKPIEAKEGPFENIANKAVQEIAIKAVETIEAIKDIKESPLKTASKQDNSNKLGQLNVANSGLVENAAQLNQNVQGNVQNNALSKGLNLQPILNALPAVYKQQQLNIQHKSVNLQPNANVQQLFNANRQPDATIQQLQQSSNNQQQQPQQYANQQQQLAPNVQKQRANVPQQQSANKQQINAENIQQQQQPNRVVNSPQPANLKPNSNFQQPSKMQPANYQHQLQQSPQQDAYVQQQNIQQEASNIQEKQSQQNSYQQVAQNLQQAANLHPEYQNNDAQAIANWEVQKVPPVINNNQNVPVQNEVVQNEKQKAHSHSPDEPQSYKEGEDFESEKLKNIAQNVPIPIAINGNVNKKSQVEPKPPSNNKRENNNLNVLDSNNIQQNSNNIQNIGANAFDNNVKENINNSPLIIRQKREVVDCTKTNTLNPEDKEICKKLVNNPTKIDDTQGILKIDNNLSKLELPKDDSQSILKSYTLGNVELPKIIPLHETIIHHVRTLKSLPEPEKNKR